MTRQLQRQTQRKMRKIKIVGSDMKLTAASGLNRVLELFGDELAAIRRATYC